MAEETRDDHAVRVARNQSLFREVNERLSDMNESFRLVVSDPDWVCECADPACVEKMALSVDEYQALRSEPTHFAVSPSPSHVFFEFEKVVGQTDRYWIVEKFGTAGAVAEEVAEDVAETSPPSAS
jgi:hypothetical protein